MRDAKGVGPAHVSDAPPAQNLMPSCLYTADTTARVSRVLPRYFDAAHRSPIGKLKQFAMREKFAAPAKCSRQLIYKNTAGIFF